jgi:hypothetical protein
VESEVSVNQFTVKFVHEGKEKLNSKSIKLFSNCNNSVIVCIIEYFMSHGFICRGMKAAQIDTQMQKQL